MGELSTERRYPTKTVVMKSTLVAVVGFVEMWIVRILTQQDGNGSKSELKSERAFRIGEEMWISGSGDVGNSWGIVELVDECG